MSAISAVFCFAAWTAKFWRPKGFEKLFSSLSKILTKPPAGIFWSTNSCNQAHFVYLYCPISLLHARVSQVFLNTCMRVCGDTSIGSGVCFSLFMVSACYWRGRLCFGGVRERGFVLYISLFLRVLGRCVCVCLYTCLHTHKLLGYLMWAQVWDEHLESQKNPDRLKRIIYVDRIGVHSFEESRRCDNNQQITVSHFGAH